MTKRFLALIFLAASCSQPGTPDREKEHQIQFDSAWKSRDSVEILKARTQLSSEEGRDPYILYSRSWILSRKGNLPLALKTADSLVLGYPAFARGYYLRANLKAGSGNLEGAFKDYENAIKRDPGLYEAFLNRGAAYFQDKHPEHAIPDFRKASQLRPDDFQPWLNLGNAFASASSLDSACNCWQEAGKRGSAKALDLISKYCAKP